jgi:broad specificity phosphatase PhoE
MQDRETKTLRIILVRHGESEGNRDRLFTTSPEARLTDLGRQQAQQTAAFIARMFKPQMLIASSYARAKETAEIIGRELGLEVEVKQGLHEQSYGELAGKAYDLVFEDPGYDHSRPWQYRPPGGETREEVRTRVVPVLERLAAECESEVVIVSHGGVMQAIWAHLSGRWEDAHLPPNAGIVLVEYIDGRFSEPRVVAESEPTVRVGHL